MLTYGKHFKNTVQRQRHTDKLLGSGMNGPDLVSHSCLGTKGPDRSWKVYSSSKGYKKEHGPKEINGIHEENKMG